MVIKIGDIEDKKTDEVIEDNSLDEEVINLNLYEDISRGYDTISYYLDDGVYYDPVGFKNVIRHPGDNSYALCELAERLFNTNGFYSNEIIRSISGVDLVHIISPLKTGKEATDAKEEYYDFTTEIGIDAAADDMLLDTQKFGVYFGYLEYNRSRKDKKLINPRIISLPPKYIKIFGNNGKTVGIAIDLYQVISKDKQSLFPKSLRTRITAAIGRVKNNTKIKADDVFNDDKFYQYKDQYVKINSDRTIVVINGNNRRSTWGQIPLINTLDQISNDLRVEERIAKAIKTGGKNVVTQVMPGNDSKGVGIRSKTVTLSKQASTEQHKNLKTVVESTRNNDSLSAEPGTLFNVLKLEDMFANYNSADGMSRIAFNGGVPYTVATGKAEGKAIENYTKNSLNVLYKNLIKFSREIDKAFHALYSKEKMVATLLYIKSNDYIRKDEFGLASKVFIDAGGSYEYLIAASGINPRGYIAQMYDERDKKYDEKFPPHLTANNISKDDENVTGRNNEGKSSEDGGSGE